MYADASVTYLQERVGRLRVRVRAAVARRRAADPGADDPFRGLYVSDAEVDDLLDDDRVRPPIGPDDAPPPYPRDGGTGDEAERAGGPEPRLSRLARAFGLRPFDEQLLLVALAPDLDPGFERLYAYLQDDVSRRRASTGLALELCGGPAALGTSRLRLMHPSALVDSGLLAVEEPERPFLTRGLRVPDRVLAWLLGHDEPTPEVAELLTVPSGMAVGDPDMLARALRDGVRLAYLQEPVGGAGLSLAAAAVARAGSHCLAIDLTRLGPPGTESAVAAPCGLEARLSGAVLVVGPVEVLADRGAAAVRGFAHLPAPLVLLGGRTWDPRWSDRVPLVLPAPAPTPYEREAIWRANLPAADGEQATVQFRLTPEQVVRAATAATLRAASHSRAVTADDLRHGARAQNAAGLERLARRIEPKVSWTDLVLTPPVVAQLHELVSRIRRRDQVYGKWRLGASSSKGHGVKALFAGESGTGKTISAEGIAGRLGLDLYVIDLSTVVDKYVGETEKNLDRIFDEADRVNGVLLFDEADALFGKRTEVKDSHDRFANVEVAYLLQRMESFDGLAILTTNLRSNIDDAFLRRIDAIIEFPMPDEPDRRRLWELNLPPTMPRTGRLDLDFLAASFKLSGGNIRNIAVGAAFLAADADRPVSMAELIRATEREYRKLGHMVVPQEFGPYYDLLATDN